MMVYECFRQNINKQTTVDFHYENTVRNDKCHLERISPHSTRTLDYTVHSPYQSKHSVEHFKYSNEKLPMS